MIWNTQFLSTIIIEQELMPNLYNVSVTFDCEVDDFCLQNIGFERIKYFFNSLLRDTVIASKHNKATKSMMKSFNINWMLLPSEPNDQMVLWCLYHKLSSVLEKNFEILDMSIDSRQGDNISYHYDGESLEMDIDPWLVNNKKIKPWWERPDQALYDATFSPTKDKVEIYYGQSSWEDIGLGWVTEKDLKKSNPKGKVVKPKKFQLKVVDGKNAT